MSRQKRLVLFFMTAPRLLGGCFEEKKPPEMDAMPVKVTTPTFKRLTEWNEYTGRFRARERVEIRARVSGYLESVHFTDGGHVKKGQTLFVIDPRPYRYTLDKANAQFELAKKDYERAKNLRAANAVSQQDLDEKYQAFQSAKSDADTAKLNLDFTQVKSPIAGKISRKQVDVGNLITGGDVSGTLLTTVVSQNPIDFYIESSEQEVLRYTQPDKTLTNYSVPLGQQPLEIKLQNEKDYTHKGMIDFVDNELDAETGTVLVRGTLDNSDGKLTPGFFGRARIPATVEYEAMLVPDSVVGTNQTMKFVFVVNDQNMVEPRPVTLGPLHDGGMRIIRSGLQKNDKVVVSGLTILRPGIKVAPQPADAPSTDTQKNEKK
jgi:RND family efflux transporter MFP subunit